MVHTRLPLILVLAVLAAPCISAAETFHCLSLDSGTALPAKGLELGLEYSFHWFPIEPISIVPYFRLNLNAVTSLDSWARSFEAANSWAGYCTPFLNVLLLGIPYVIAASVSGVESQSFFCPGLEFRYHPVRMGLLDLAIGVGMASNPLRAFQEDADAMQFFFYPVATAAIQSSITYKALLAKAWISYEYECFADYAGLNPHGFYWGASVGWRFAVRP